MIEPDLKALAYPNGKTAFGEVKLIDLYEIIKKIEFLDGDIAEVGTYQGGIAKLMADKYPNKNIWVFDTFEGIPNSAIENDGENRFIKGEFSNVNFEEVCAYLNNTNIHICKGYFPNTAFIISELQNKNFSFVLCDGDTYQTTLDCIKFFLPKMIIGGIIAFDDYGWYRCPGVKKALDELMPENKYKRIITEHEFCSVVIE